MEPSVTLLLVEFILGLAALIVLHEFGHYLASKWLKIEVEEFGIGFPPRLAKLFKVQETEFTLNWIPLGGFVRPKGENDPDVPGGLASASPWVRLGVMVAGPAMNLLLGVVLFIIFFWQNGAPDPSRIIVLEVAKGSPAESAGLQPDDLLLAVNGVKIDSTEQMSSLIADNLGKPTQITLQRQGEELIVTLTPRQSPPEGQGPIGIRMTNPMQSVGLGQAVWMGASQAYENARGILLLPVRMLAGQAKPEEGRLVGYKGMFDIYQQEQVNRSLFFAAISISLGVLNLLPIPALDGGRILLTLPEIFLRRRVPPKYENVIHLVGFALLLLLIIYINVQDFINPILLPK
jgi:regulator of sigma E protease